MNFAEWVSSVFGVTVTSAALLSFVVYLLRDVLMERIKNSIKHEYDKELETHKANLKRDYDVQIEKLRADAAERNIKLTKVFDKQAEAIAEIYKRLLGLHKAAEECTQLIEKTSPQKSEAEKNFHAKRREFVDYYEPNRIYIFRQTHQKVLGFYHAVSDMQWNHHVATSQNNFEAMRHRMEEYQKFAKTAQEFLDVLAEDFQSILGFPAESKAVAANLHE